MLLTIDIGNTNIVWGLFDGETLLHKWSMGTDISRSAEEYTEMADLCLLRKQIRAGSITGVAVANVVPPMLNKIIEVCVVLFGQKPLIVGPGVKTRLKIRFEPPTELGADRIANAVAACRIYGKNIIVVDLGTATTFDCITNGEYAGGAVSPGLLTGIEGLTASAPRLPRVDLIKPQTAIGRTVTTALQSGIVNGHAALLEGMVERILQEIGPAEVIITGDHAEIVRPALRISHTLDTSLTLKGLRYIYDYTKTTDA
ncbi:MAG: type III pantothenate kinase [Bacillota bacterium]|nr:type III pantothenate kinase [Bacillota bacterium]